MTEVFTVMVFVGGPGGGNPVPLVRDARALSAAQMQAVAREHGHESAFIVEPTDARADWRLRFFVPQHEMEMCGHATVGTLWALRQWGLWTADSAVVETLSGLVDVLWDEAAGRVWISQPRVQIDHLSATAGQLAREVLGQPTLAAGQAVVNATTSRTKTLLPMASVEALHALAPDLARMEAVCAALDSTGLYPYALAGPGTVHARQFPKSSGYPEDAATGIAAAALWGQLAATGRIAVGTPAEPIGCVVRQGEAMGRPSAIELRPRFADDGAIAGCWLSGQVAWSA